VSDARAFSIHFLREFHPADAERSGNETPDEPFAPEFVYDAMRLTKRFDTMRVSAIVC
jgi:ubiquitin carboxyl-terminal hydrolase 10